MGWGDEIMASGQARIAQQTDPRRVMIVDALGVPRWHEIWRGNPRIAHPDEFVGSVAGEFQTILNAPRARPYIAAKSDERWTWKDFDCQPGEIYFNGHERAFAAQHQPHIVVVPTLKARASPNKQWCGWVAFARSAHKMGIRLTQLSPPGTQRLPYADHAVAPDFRRACAVLAKARAFVGHEGGMHHAAAALGIPAVVIFGGFISPAQTGYTTHRNLFTGGEACGMRVPCKHCAAAMAAITPQMVLNELTEILSGK